MAGMQSRLTALLAPTVEALGFELWGVEYRLRGRRATVRVYIDAAEGVSVDDCATVSRQLSAVLDVEDPLPGQYTLEVSSPGMDRRLFTLAQCAAWVGARVRVTLREPWEGRRRYTGRLLGVEGEDMVLRADETEWLFPFDAIDIAQVLPEFGDTGKRRDTKN